MDFGSLLHVAKKNESAKGEVKYYSTKFEPPKKEPRNKSQLSINIQKFLAKKEEEEKRKALEAKKKRDELLAKRDPKLKKKILNHLKNCKSANKAVLEEAIDHVNTAVTLQGCDQPDEDDYGYVSQEASAFYSKMMEKYSNIPEEKKFPDRHKRVNKDLMSTKDRVRAALEKEREDAMLPHRRHRRTKAELSQENGNGSSDLSFGRPMTYSPTEDFNKKQESKPKPKNKSMPPPMDFNELLKIAQQKQLEPVKLEPKVEKKVDHEPERLMTSKEKREFEEMQARKEARKKRDLERQQALNNKLNPLKNSDRSKSEDIERKLFNKNASETYQEVKNKIPVNNPNGRIPKLNGYKSKTEADIHCSSTHTTKTTPVKITNGKKESSARISPMEINKNDRASAKSNIGENSLMRKSSSTNDVRNGTKDLLHKSKINGVLPQRSQEISIRDKQRVAINKEVQLTSQNPNSKAKPNTTESRKLPPPQDVKTVRKFPPEDVKTTRQFPPNDLKTTRQFPPNDLKTTRPFPPNDIKTTRQFPPKDIRGTKASERTMPSKSQRPMTNKRRILDDDSEYDSELDDFIDDGPEEAENDYSKHIKDIFGYDKSRYRDEDYDDANMESNFAQVMREEYISKKIGIMEDLEDMKMEAMEKKMKAKKKRLK